MVHGFCEHKCKREVPSKDDFAIIDGIISVVNGTGETSVSYPNGFNIDNCVVISFGSKPDETNGVYNYGFTHNETGFLAGSLSRKVALYSNGINIKYFNTTNSGTKNYKFKIVLMKI